MSLNLIIMLIIGMVVLGLVIGFVNSLVSKGVEGFDDQIGENQQLKLDEVRNSPDNLAVIPGPSLSVPTGDQTNVFIKVRAYGEEVDCNPGNLDCTNIKYKVINEGGETIDSNERLILTGPGFQAKDGSEDAKMYTLKAVNKDGDAIGTGVYYVKIGFYGDPEDGPDESVTLTVTVE